jgi:hypothetical protein
VTFTAEGFDFDEFKSRGLHEKHAVKGCPCAQLIKHYAMETNGGVEV